MKTPVRIDGPVKISPDCRVDLAPYLNELDHHRRGFDINFKVASIELDDDHLQVEESTEHVISSVGSFHTSLAFTVDDEELTERYVDFALSPSNALFLVACDRRVKSVMLDYVDIKPL